MEVSLASLLSQAATFRVQLADPSDPGWKKKERGHKSREQALRVVTSDSSNHIGVDVCEMESIGGNVRLW